MLKMTNRNVNRKLLPQHRRCFANNLKMCGFASKFAVYLRDMRLGTTVCNIKFTTDIQKYLLGCCIIDR